MPQIESHHISAEQPLNGLREIGLWRFDFQNNVFLQRNGSLLKWTFRAYGRRGGAASRTRGAHALPGI